MKSTTNGDSEVGQLFRECLAHDGLADPRGAWAQGHNSAPPRADQFE